VSVGVISRPTDRIQVWQSSEHRCLDQLIIRVQSDYTRTILGNTVQSLSRLVHAWWSRRVRWLLESWQVVNNTRLTTDARQSNMPHVFIVSPINDLNQMIMKTTVKWNVPFLFVLESHEWSVSLYSQYYLGGLQVNPAELPLARCYSIGISRKVAIAEWATSWQRTKSCPCEQGFQWRPSLTQACSLKLRHVDLGQYLDGWPPGKTGRCEPGFVRRCNPWPTVCIVVIVLTRTLNESIQTKPNHVSILRQWSQDHRDTKVWK